MLERELMGDCRDGHDQNTLYTYIKNSKNNFLNITQKREKKEKR